MSFYLLKVVWLSLSVPLAFTFIAALTTVGTRTRQRRNHNENEQKMIERKREIQVNLFKTKKRSARDTILALAGSKVTHLNLQFIKGISCARVHRIRQHLTLFHSLNSHVRNDFSMFAHILWHANFHCLQQRIRIPLLKYHVHAYLRFRTIICRDGKR